MTQTPWGPANLILSPAMPSIVSAGGLRFCVVRTQPPGLCPFVQPHPAGPRLPWVAAPWVITGQHDKLFGDLKQSGLI